MNKHIKPIMYLMAAFIFLSDKLSAQVPELASTEKYKLVHLLYANSSGEKGQTDFFYSNQGQLVDGRWYLLDSTRSSDNLYTYENDLLIEKYRVFSDSVTIRQHFYYDSLKRLSKETFYRSDGTYGKAEYRYKEGKLIRVLCENHNGWFSGEIRCCFKGSGESVGAELIRNDETIGSVQYFYNDKGLLYKEIWDFNGKWTQELVYSYYEKPEKLYSSSNALINPNAFYRLVGEKYCYAGKKGGPSTFFYDPEGKLFKKVFTRSDGMSTTTLYEYTLTGQLKSSNRRFSNGLNAIFEYTYNPESKMISRIFNQSDGEAGSEAYQYDAAGSLSKAFYKNMDSWLSGTIIFSSNFLGDPETAIFKGDNDFDAEIQFSYDRYNNLIRINWDFSFGESQYYEFEYERLF